MAYYTKVIQSGESAKYFGKLHWIIYKNAVLFCLLAVIAPTIMMGRNADVASISFAVLLALGCASFVRSWFRRITTEIVVTDRRIIYKTGWIARRTQEINITKVETVDVSQSIIGRVLGYGTVLVRGIGSSWEPLIQMSAPLELRNAIIVG